MNVTNGPEETSDQVRMECQKDGLPVLELSARDSAAFFEELLDPMPVNSRLRETICRYREFTGYEELGQERPGKMSRAG